MSIIIFLIILLVLVIAHEFGHFIVAKKSGIRVDEFAFGFPPKLFSLKKGETTYAFNALPIGGYVKIYGEDPTQEVEGDVARSFSHKPRYIQSMVILAGITANIVVAWLLFTMILSIGMKTSIGGNTFGTLSNVEVMVTQVVPGSPAAKAGISSGDVLVHLRDNTSKEEVKVTTPEVVTAFIGSKQETPITVTVARKGVLQEISVVPQIGVSPSGKPAIGIAMDEAGLLKLPIHLAALEAGVKTYDYTVSTAIGIFDFLYQTITGHADFQEVSGPVGIVGAVGDAAKLGFVNVLFFAALISINLAVINLIPFPALDGGRFFFIVIEAIIRKPLPAQVTSWTNAIGFGALMLLMLVVTYHDILKLFN
ncbi:MAG TPA: RIP metalloprotease RseP [Candidatus Paceibacterota bacterium]|nr:RIP metalloprotease RseP [Candidatus Paceibacterota bacterium]